MNQPVNAATKTIHMQEAIEEYLEAREDYLLAVAVLERNEPTINLAELEKRLDWAHRNYSDAWSSDLNLEEE